MSLRTEGWIIDEVTESETQMQKGPSFVDVEQLSGCDLSNQSRVVEGREEISGYPDQMTT